MGQGLERLQAGLTPQTRISPERLDELSQAESGSAATSPEAAAAPEAEPMAGSWRPPGIQGMDVSAYQGNVNWATAWAQGARFAYVKASEGTFYKNPNFNQQYNGSANVGMYRGAYHFAMPTLTSGREQANYFVDNGGGWSSDGKTLPPLLDIEYNPYDAKTMPSGRGDTCYAMSSAELISWIRDFSNTIKARTGRLPMIYTATNWWNYCIGKTTAFADHPLHVAAYNEVGAGPVPSGWKTYSFWQYSSTGPFVGDSNVWNGSAAGLAAFVRGAAPAPTTPFKDISTSQLFYKEMVWLAKTGISTGWKESDGTRTYRPLLPINRDAMAAFMYRAAGSPPYTAPKISPFKDVKPDQLFYKEMAWLAEKGISTGWTETDGTRTYRALQPINRDAMAAFMYRLADSPSYTPPRTSPFKDVKTDQLFYQEMAWLAETGISTGWTETDGRRTYRALQPINRDAMAAFIYRFSNR
ncbi:lysozyme [uncultured Arthrobacter sp.]|uniref:lysozyme n=1 Tax=uncultured Arthrobacter sp. TaxID=114050 RepID=UPI00345BDDF6